MTQKIKDYIASQKRRPIEEAQKDGTAVCLAYRYPSDSVKKHIESCHGPCEQEELVTIGRWWRDAWRIGPDQIHPPHSFCPIPDDKLAELCEVLLDFVTAAACETETHRGAFKDFEEPTWRAQRAAGVIEQAEQIIGGE